MLVIGFPRDHSLTAQGPDQVGGLGEEGSEETAGPAEEGVLWFCPWFVVEGTEGHLHLYMLSYSAIGLDAHTTMSETAVTDSRVCVALRRASTFHPSDDT